MGVEKGSHVNPAPLREPVSTIVAFRNQWLIIATNLAFNGSSQHVKHRDEETLFEVILGTGEYGVSQ